MVRACRRLAERGVEFDLAVVGDHTGGDAATIDPLLDELGDRVVARGLQPRAEYLALLRRADVVVSTARGENFGIAVVEAVAAGAWPVLPAALSYPEVLPTSAHAACLYEPGGLGRLLGQVVDATSHGASAPAGLAEAMDAYAWPAIAAALDERVDALIAG